MSLFKKTKDYFGLSILPRKLQVVLLDRKGQQVVSWAQASLDEKVVKDSQVVDPKKLAAAIKKLLAKAHITQEKVVVGIPESKAFTKVIFLPKKLKPSELDEAVRWQARSFLPTPLEDSYLDWKLVSDPEDDQHIILTVSVPKKVIDGYVEALHQAGLQPLSFETTSVSLARLIQDQKDLSLIAEVQPTGAILTLASGPRIRASSIVSLTGEENGTGLSYFLETLKKMVNFYEKKYKNKKIRQIYLCGEAATTHLKDQVHRQLKRPAQLCPLKLSNLSVQKASALAVAISLSRRKVASPEDQATINLLPPQIQASYQQVEQDKAIRFALSVLTLSLLVAVGLAASLFFLFQHRLSSLHTAEQAAAPQASLTASASAQISKINLKAQRIVNLAQLRVFPQETLQQVLDAVPPSVILTDLEYDLQTGTISLAGIAPQRQDLLTFKKNLLATKKFGSIVIPLSSLEKEENLTFNLSFSLVSEDQQPRKLRL